MPPKQKKQPKNAYYFYMVKRKAELERQGYRFPGGMKDVANAVGADWAAMSAEDKMDYEEEARKAKEDGKHDLTNKYTSTGESYAAVQRRLQDDKFLSEEQESYITELGMGTGALDRVFVLIKTIHCVEQIIERNQRIYWPLEIGMVAFNLRDGLKSMYWTLIDTQKTPVGYASAAKECSEETGLPEPGSASMQGYRDYNVIMKHVQGFIQHWTKQGYRKGPIVFALDGETEHARGCLKWISNHVDGDKRRDQHMFVENLKFYKLPKLILRLAQYAHELDEKYTNVLVTHKLELSAASIVSKGCYDYKDEITCQFHKTEKASLKMYTCCRNITLRRMYLMYEEFLPAFGLEKTNRHDMQKLKEAQQSKAKQNAARMAAGPPPEASYSAPPMSYAAPVAKVGSGWGDVPRRSSGMEIDEEDVSDTSLGRSKRKFEDDDWARRGQGPPPKRDSFSSDSFRRDRDPRDSPSPPLTSTYQRLPPEEDFQPTPTAEFVPWGSKRPTIEVAFADNDFPALHEVQSKPAMKGMGRGMGRGRGRQENDEEDSFDRDRDARKYY